MAKGKYADVIDDLPRAALVEPKYQAKIDEEKRKIAEEIGQAKTSASLASLYLEAREEKEAVEELLSAKNLELEALSQLLIEQYEIDGITSTRLDSGESISIYYEPYAVTKDREALWRWCKENGLERSMNLPWQTLNSLVKERLLNGDPEPEGVEAHARVKIVRRK